MGTLFTLTFYCHQDTVAHEMARGAFDRIDSLNHIFSDYALDSEVGRLSKYPTINQYYEVSSTLYDLIQISLDLSRRTDGAFDVTLGQLTKLWRRAIRRNELPAKQAVEQALSQSGFKAIMLDPKRKAVSFDRMGVKLDFGGIAKGFAADEVIRFFTDRDIDRCMIDAGGDIVAGNRPPGKDGWIIQLSEGGGSVSRILLENGAIASSGDTYQYLEFDGVRYSHIVDPKTGYGIQNGSEVFIKAPKGYLADALASACSVLDPADCDEILSRFREASLINPN